MKRSSEMSTSQLQMDDDASTDGPPLRDLSILRKPIKTAVAGFNEARKAYEDGTEEVSVSSHILYICIV